MLTLALTRPQLRWVARMPSSTKSQRLWAERALTGFSFVMGGYAATAVWMSLYGEFGSETNHLLEVAAYFLIVYAGLVHFEPFVNEWRLRTGAGALALYSSIAFSAAIIGSIIAEFSLRSHVPADTRLAAITICATVGPAWLFYRYSARLDAALDRWLDTTGKKISR